jgi:gliding motility-associated-like protein
MLAAAGGTAPYFYSVDGNTVNPTSVEVAPGQHQFQVSDQNGCLFDSSAFFQVPAQVFISLPADTSLKIGQLLRLTAITNLSTWSQITWSPLYDASGANTLTQTWVPEKSELITISITDTTGCTASASIQINVQDIADVYIPNVFLPNLDGTNDFWKIYIGIGVLGIDELMIFDRWGSSVYQLNEPLTPGDWNAWQGWDGRIRGKNADAGVYVYYAKIKLANGSTKLFKGDVTLLR